MKKPLIITGVSLIVLAGGGYFGYRSLVSGNKAVIRADLSERSQEFLRSQSASNGADLQNVSLRKVHFGEHDFDSQRRFVKNCYSLVVPFQIEDDRTNAPCVYYAILSSPRGTMTTSLRTVGFRNANEAPDANLRRGKPEQYREETIVVNGTTYDVFTDELSGTEKSAFGMHDGKLFTLSLSIGASDDVQTRQLKKILGSVEFK